MNSSSENTIQILEKNIYLFLKFLRSIFDNSQKIIITIPNKIKLNLKNEVTQSENLEIIFLDKDDENLNWKFGLSNYSGIGIRWELKKNNLLVNCGNHIIMYKNGIPIGIDFGFGLENLVQVKLNLPHKILASPFSSVFSNILEECNDLNIKMVDALATYITIIDETNFANDITKNLKKIQAYYLKSIIFLMKQMTEEKFNLIFDSIISTNKNWIKKEKKIKQFLFEKINKKLKHIKEM